MQGSRATEKEFVARPATFHPKRGGGDDDGDNG